MQLAINAQQLGGTHSLSEILEIVRSMGVGSVEIWPHNLEGGNAPEEKQRYEHKDIIGAKRLIDSFGMQVACVTLGFRAMAMCAEKGPTAGTNALKGTVDAAVTLDARIVNCYLAGAPTDFFIEEAKLAAEYAGEHGIMMVLENEAHDDSATAQGIRSIVEAIGSAHFGALYDPCNFYQAIEEPYPAAYEVLKDFIRYVHLKGGCHYGSQWCPKQGGALRGREDAFIGYIPIPESGFNIDGIIQRLSRDGYEGFVTLEPHVAPEQVMDFYQIEVPYVRDRIGRVNETGVA